jgi:hypothetical protein
VLHVVFVHAALCIAKLNRTPRDAGFNTANNSVSCAEEIHGSSIEKLETKICIGHSVGQADLINTVRI